MGEKTSVNILLLVLCGCFIMVIMAVLIIVFVINYQRKMTLHTHNLQILESEKKLELFKATVEVQDREREKIAKNLHDDIGPFLTVLKLNYYKHQKKAPVELKELLEKDMELIDTSIEGIRRVCNDLVPAMLVQFGFLKGLENFISNLKSDVIITTHSDQRIDECILDETQNLNLYRVCQEILNNILKHSNATKISLRFIIDYKLNIFFAHNGISISNEEIALLMKENKGLGLKSIQSRMLLLDGTISYLKNSDHKIKLSIPINHGV